MRALIPLRPENMSKIPLTQDEQTALTWYVLSGCSRKDAYITFVRPDLLPSKNKPAVDEFIKQYFARKEVKDYLAAYEETMDHCLHPNKSRVPTGSVEERKALAKTKLIEFATGLAENIDEAQDPEYVLKIADKVGLLDSEEKVVEEPRRYLPVTCGGCAYRKFVEENCEVVESGMEIETDIDKTEEYGN